LPPDEAILDLELTLPTAAASRLVRMKLPGIERRARARSFAFHSILHDSADNALAANALTLIEERGSWRVERLYPGKGHWWPPGVPPPQAAAALSRDALGVELPASLIPRAALEGRTTTLHLAAGEDALMLTLRQATLRAVAAEGHLARLIVSGPEAAVAALAHRLASDIDAAIPRASLAAEALAASLGTPAQARASGPPQIAGDMTVRDAVRYLVGHLTDVILYWAPQAALDAGPEPVHQARVALRRLRSGLSMFRHQAPSPALEQAREELRDLASRLGPARDWDVFTAGTARLVWTAFPQESALRRLLSDSARRRRDVYRELTAWLHSAAYRQLGIRLALLAAGNAWESGIPPAMLPGLDAPIGAVAGQILGRRLRKLKRGATDIERLPEPELHEIRLRTKRLRYACELFAPVFPSRGMHRMVRRLTALEDNLGHLNDGAVAAGLLAELGDGGARRSLAIGLVRGFVAGRSGSVRKDIRAAWDRFSELTPPWKQ
jgi:triphosphatase